MGINDAAEMLEEAKAEVIRLERELAIATTPRIITDVDEVAAMGRGSVLLCSEDEVFWLPPEPPDDLRETDEPMGRYWFAPGYAPEQFTWTDEQVADWAPLTILHEGPQL